MKFVFSYDVREGQKVESSWSYPRPTAQDLQKVMDTFMFLRDRPNFKYTLGD